MRALAREVIRGMVECSIYLFIFAWCYIPIYMFDCCIEPFLLEYHLLKWLKIILLGILAFSLGTIFNISALAIALPLGGTIAADIINSLAIYKDIKILRYFVTLNWDFSWYLFGKTSQFKYTNFGFSAVVCIIYALIMIIASFFVFKKKNIKNI